MGALNYFHEASAHGFCTTAKLSCIQWKVHHNFVCRSSTCVLKVYEYHKCSHGKCFCKFNEMNFHQNFKPCINLKTILHIPKIQVRAVLFGCETSNITQ